jgi:uncharacterized protein (DUF433 family)
MLELLSSGMTMEELLTDYPDLVKENFFGLYYTDKEYLQNNLMKFIVDAQF